MKNKINYQKNLDQTINEIVNSDKTPKLLLHSCCAPCSSYVLEYLTQYFAITVYYYNPNITDNNEYLKRVNEQKRFISEFPNLNKIEFYEGKYKPQDFYNSIEGFEDAPEGGKRCINCYYLRLKTAAIFAKNNGFDYFTTTLTISPHKNSRIINNLGNGLEKKFNIKYLHSDFKKKNGYKRSIELSKEYNLYRQNYCGCEY